MHEPFDITTIIFALLAIFVVWKLSSVLGMRTGQEKPPADPFSRPPPARRDPAATEGNVIRLPGAANDERGQSGRSPSPEVSRWDGFAEPSTALWDQLESLGHADPNFEAKAFLDGAKGAYELILNAFATGDETVLRNLLAPDVFASFSKAITDRVARGETVETTLVSIDKASFDHVEMLGRTANVSVLFAAKLITATRDKDGAVIDGNPEKTVDVTDVWTFTRDTNSRDPNWKLAGTQTRAA